MGRRVHRVTASVAAALAVVTLTMIVIDSDSESSSIVVPVPDSVEPSTSRLTPTEIATELSVGLPSVAATLEQPIRSTSTRQRSTTTNTPPAQPPATTQPSSGQAPAPNRFDPSASFRIVNHVNSLALDSGGNVQPGTTMKFWESSSPSPNLQFQLLETGSGYYRLINRTNGMAVDGRGATTAGSSVGQRPWNSAPSLQWMPVEVGNGLFTLTNRATGLLLDGAGRGTQMGSQAKQWPPTGSQNQLWRIVRV